MTHAQTVQQSDVTPEPPPVVNAYAYEKLLSRLLTEGSGYGKTEPIAAYLLRDVFLIQEPHPKNKQPPTDVGHSIGLEQKYVVMDLSLWKNEFIRGLALQEIFVDYAKRLIGEKDINAPDFKSPGVWTVKKSAFEFDYHRREGVDENGKPLNIYDPNPDAYRLCLECTEPVTIPTQWGEPWAIGAGGTLAIRERDVEKLAEALQAVRQGAKIRDTLYNPPRGKQFSKLDVYGMAPGFLGSNYNRISLHQKTQELCAAWAKVAPRRQTAAPASAIESSPAQDAIASNIIRLR